jgi:AcrR family transcriptional regulator
MLRPMARSGPSSPPDPRNVQRRNAAERILRGAATRLSEIGAAELSLQDVAAAAGVSKALIHYHFADKELLLVRVVEWTTGEVVQREEQALTNAVAASAVDALWMCLVTELELGHLRVLLELGQYRAPQVQDAVARSLGERRAATVRTIDRLFALLELRPRVPTELLASVVTAFTDGLASRPRRDDTTEARVAFDVFWLSILSLAE